MSKAGLLYYLKKPQRIYAFLSKYGLLDWMPDKQYLEMAYRLNNGVKLDIDHPKTFNEKIQWLKVYDRKPEYTIMVDKYQAKQYVANIIGNDHIIPTLGVWDSFDEIDFDQLPDQFVLKCTHDSGGLVICRDKHLLNIENARKKIEKSLKTDYYRVRREWPYKNVKRRIIAEKYMEDVTAEVDTFGKKSLIDYKFFCFNGEPKLLYISTGLENHPTAKISFYGMDGKEMPFHRRDYAPYHNAPIPKAFKEMSVLARQIAVEVECPFVRIDLYSINEHIYFSEITFSPCGGNIPFEPISADEELGEWLELPNK
jgi:hypothetical protein